MSTKIRKGFGEKITILRKRDGSKEALREDKVLASLKKAFEEAEKYLGRPIEGYEGYEVIAKNVIDEIKKKKEKEMELSTQEISEIIEKSIIEEIINNLDLELVAKVFVLGRIYKQANIKGAIDKRDLELTFNAIKLLEKRYLVRDPETLNAIETPQMLFKRVADHIASAEKIYGADEQVVNRISAQFYEMMSKRYFIPNTPTLMNAGLRLGQLSACFVIPVHDDMESIFEALKTMALVHKTGGGTGFDFSELRPEGDVVASTAGVASGPVSFMKIFDVATDVIKQGGKRRGANMGVLHVWHPDIEKFIKSKSGELKETQLQNFNISVAVTDQFMEKALKDEDFELVNPRTKKVVRKIRASALFRELYMSAWESGDPGILFIDEINRRSPVKHLGDIRATNPCGEQPLLPYESCNLGSINLEKFVKDGEIDWDGLAATVKMAVRFLDNVIDVNNFPVKEIEQATKLTRRIGLGVMGWAHMLIKLNIPYDSDDALYLAEKVMEWIEYNAIIESHKLAMERGSFPAFKGSDWSKGILPIDTAKPPVYKESNVSDRVKLLVKKRPEVNWDSLRDKVKEGIRNATLTTIAPTGSIGIIGGTSTGIEPIFALAFMRYVSVGTFLEVDTLFLETLDNIEGIDKYEILKEISKDGSAQKVKLPKNIKRIFVTAHDIEPEWHVKMQAAFQRYVDNAVSKTVNMRHEATVEDVKNVYILAWKLGCKGITVYRDKSKSVQVIHFGVKKEKEENKVKGSSLFRPDGEPKFRFWKSKDDKLVLDEDFTGCVTCEL
ncbi:MAG: adenosylcobalamin-dependent ribonucleoside-diphosphate reductase [Candidatus Njordarchaeia archaeon]